MKYVLTVFWAVICVAVLIFGHTEWSKKTAVHAKAEPVHDTADVPVNVEATVDSVDVPVNAEVTVDSVDIEGLMAKAQNWPDQAKKQLKSSIKNKKPFKILFVGTNEMVGWSGLINTQLVNAFGKEVIDVSTYTYNSTTRDFVQKNKQLEISSMKPQLVIFEPFLWNDNGKIPNDETAANITKIINDVKESNQTVTFLLQPSYPVYQAKYYQLQVDALRNYAKENNIVFLDHWTTWPKTTDPRLNDFLLQDRSNPNEKGNQLWAQYIGNYLIHK